MIFRFVFKMDILEIRPISTSVLCAVTNTILDLVEVLPSYSSRGGYRKGERGEESWGSGTTNTTYTHLVYPRNSKRCAQMYYLGFNINPEATYSDILDLPIVHYNISSLEPGVLGIVCCVL